MTTLPQFLMSPRTPGSFFLVALVFIVLELVYLRITSRAQHHDLGETAASVGVAIGDIVVRILTGAIAAVPMFWLYQHRLTDIPLDRAGSWVLLFIGTEFLYYWFHRASHRITWLWATHAVHHSATHFNLSAAIRLGWTGTLTGAFVFFLPVAWIGFHPAAIAFMLGLGLLYQFFLHTALDVRLGPLEKVLNSPAHHRVHHAANDSCLDTNFGNVTILFDRLFGTFAAAPDGETLHYGVKGREPSLNPFRIALAEWGWITRTLFRTPGWRAKLRVLTEPPA